MDSFVVLAHILFALLFALYLVLRFIRSLWTIGKPEKAQSIRRAFRKADLIFGALVLMAGAYPLIVLGRLEVYYLLKLTLLALILYLSRRSATLPYAAANGLCLALAAAAIWISFNRGIPMAPTDGYFSDMPIDREQITDLDRGRIIYEDLCTPCHGGDGTLGKFQAADLRTSTLSLAEKKRIIADGSPLTVMRPFGQELTEEEIAQVARYIHEILKSGEPGG